jgi:GntR family transcriptional regulator
MLSINRRSYIPIYKQIAQLIEQRINSNELRPGMQFPSEREIAEQCNVSRTTARQALEELVRQGIAYRVQGRGTFVAVPKIREVSGLGSFSDDMRSQDLTPSSRVLVQEIVHPNETVRRKMKLGEDDQVLQLDRMRLADEIPVALERASIDCRLCPGLESEDFGTQSLYACLRDKYNVYPMWAEAEIEARGAHPQEAELWGIEASEPVMAAYRLTYTESFEIIEYVESVYRGDRFTFYIGRQRIPPISPEERR